MTSEVWLTWYCVLILAASIFGGMIPVWWNLTHRWMELAVSFVAGIMFGVATLHMLPHAIVSALQPDVDPHGAVLRLMVWFVVGFVAMFLIERFFCFHHHDAPADEEHLHDADHVHGPECSHHPHSEHVHDITWSGAAVGLTLHSLLAGVALAASVSHGSHNGWLPGLGTFLVVFFAQAIRLDDHRHADGPQRLLALGAMHSERGLFTRHSGRRCAILDGIFIRGGRHVVRAPPCPGVFGRRVSVHRG